VSDPPSAFLDTSALFAAVLSPGGGARAVLILGEMGVLSLWVGRRVLAEADGVLLRKAPELRALFAMLLKEAGVRVGPDPDRPMLERARGAIAYKPDAYVLAEALAAGVDYFVTHDKEHFLANAQVSALPCEVLTPGALLAIMRARLSGHVP
jgi:predicted nucleic acid-binding protein